MHDDLIGKRACLQPGDGGMQCIIGLAVLVHLLQHAPAAAMLLVRLQLLNLPLQALHVLHDSTVTCHAMDPSPEQTLMIAGGLLDSY